MRVFGESTALWGGEFAQSKPVFNRARSIGRCFYRQRLRLENRTTAGEAKKQKSRKAPFKAGTHLLGAQELGNRMQRPNTFADNLQAGEHRNGNQSADSSPHQAETHDPVKYVYRH